MFFKYEPFFKVWPIFEMWHIFQSVTYFQCDTYFTEWRFSLNGTHFFQIWSTFYRVTHFSQCAPLYFSHVTHFFQMWPISHCKKGSPFGKVGYTKKWGHTVRNVLHWKMGHTIKNGSYLENGSKCEKWVKM